MSLYESIMDGLQEAIALERGETTQAVRHRLSLHEVKPSFAPAEIRQIRLNANMTQGIFAAVIGVTPKAVEAWEGGRSKPDGAARRTIGLLQENPRFAEEVGILER